jgi:hypothetical protein
MGIYVITAKSLKEMLEQHMPDANDFGNEVIPAARKMGYPVQVSGMGGGHRRGGGLVRRSHGGTTWRSRGVTGSDWHARPP